MSKAIFIRKIIENTGLTKQQATSSYNAIEGLIKESLAKGQDVRIPGFGAFNVSERASYKGRNPKTGKEIIIPPAKQVRFKPAKKLKEAVNK